MPFPFCAPTEGRFYFILFVKKQHERILKMKRLLLISVSLLLVLACAFSMFACDFMEEETTAETLANNKQTEAPKAENDSTEENVANDENQTNEKKDEVEATGLWASAKYRSNTTIGEGSKSVSFDIEAEGKKITITLKTDKNTLGEAMYEHDLINDPTFFDTLNGMLASWDKDQAYWAFYQGENFMMVGVGDTTIEGGEAYRFVYTK